MTEEFRTCSRCAETKPLVDFPRDKSARGGYRANCKVCQRIYVAGYVARNEERVKAYQAQYRAAHREKARATTRQWVADNPEWARRLNDEYRADPAHKEIARQRATAFRKANPEKRLEYGRRRRARMRASAVGKTVISPEQLAAKKAYWGDRCWMCHGPAGAWDHVKPINRQGAHILANLRPACLPCNTRKKDCWPYAAVLERVS